MAILAAIMIGAGLAAYGSEFPHLSAPLLLGGCVCALLAATVSRRRARR
jgi:hypothetical protein